MTLLRAVLAVVLAAGLNGAAFAADSSRTLRVVPQSDLTVLDPMFGTAWISLISGEMIWESLFTWDSQLQPQPMMVDTWSTAPDGLTWRFTLREGLRFHTGEPVTPADVIASTRRWIALDPVGAKVGAVLADLSADGDRTVVFHLRTPFPALLHALAAAPARFPAVMRAKDILNADGTPILTQVSNAVGSGPFRWKADEQVSGSLAVWERNPDYVPRREPPDGLAGARIVKVDRVEWHIIPDAATAAAALTAGEVDMLERPVLDQVELLARQPGIRIVKLTPVQAQNMLRANATIPPFDNPKMRLALAYVIDQADEMAAGWGDPSHWRTCNAYFVCGTRNGTEAGAEGFHQDFARARQLAQEAGYRGEPLVFVATKEIPTLGQMSVAYDALKRAGFNVEMRWADWGTVGALLRKRDGWNLFLTGAPGAMMFDPLTNIATDMSCDGKNFVGWECDPHAEELRTAVMNSSDADQPGRLDAYVRYLAQAQPYRVLGQYDTLTAVRSDVKGLLESPVLAYWNIEKTP